MKCNEAWKLKRGLKKTQKQAEEELLDKHGLIAQPVRASA